MNRTARTRVSAALFRRPWLRAGLLLSAPGGVVRADLPRARSSLLFISALWSVDSFTGNLVHSWTLDNFETLFKVRAYRTIALRTIGIAAAVTVTDVDPRAAVRLLRRADRPPRLQACPVRGGADPALVELPRARVRVAADPRQRRDPQLVRSSSIGLGSVNIGYSNWAMWIVFSYIWLPFMILPVWAAIERVPDSYIEASADLGARGWRTFRSILLPLILPGIAAGLDLHLLADARRLHHAHARRRSGLGLHRQRRLPERGHRQQRARSPRRSRRCRW